MLITAGYTAVMMAFYRTGVAIELGVATAVTGIALAIASGVGLRDRNMILGFVGLLVISYLFALENVPWFLAIIFAAAIVLIVPLVASVIRVAKPGRA